jgi:hypothetical protein
MKLSAIYGLLFILLLSSCSKNEKKILLVNKGRAIVDVDAKSAVIKDAAGSEEHEMSYNTGDKVSIKVKAEDKDYTINIPENGYYLLNAKNDTIIGSYQKYSAPKTAVDTFTMITQEMIKKSIDSLVALIEGKNVSAANRNYFILPFTAAKITNNMNAVIIAPFHNITTLEKDGDKDPEVYRFFSIKEIREKIEKQKAMTIYKQPAPAK